MQTQQKQIHNSHDNKIVTLMKLLMVNNRLSFSLSNNKQLCFITPEYSTKEADEFVAILNKLTNNGLQSYIQRIPDSQRSNQRIVVNFVATITDDEITKLYNIKIQNLIKLLDSLNQIEDFSCRDGEWIICGDTLTIAYRAYE